MISSFTKFYFGQAKQALELHEHRATHGPDATVGSYGPLRDWPPKTSDDAVDKGYLEPLSAKRLESKAAWWTLWLAKLWLPFVTKDCPETPFLIRPSSSRLNLNWHISRSNFDSCNVNSWVLRLTSWMWKHGAECDAQNCLPHQDFWLFQTKVFAAFDFLFSKENVFPPPFGSGKN
jgi:hypothetical protein